MSDAKDNRADKLLEKGTDTKESEEAPRHKEHQEARWPEKQ
jgi:hypothetical protein